MEDGAYRSNAILTILHTTYGRRNRKSRSAEYEQTTGQCNSLNTNCCLNSCTNLTLDSIASDSVRTHQ